jgi:hypothetical protein
MSESSSWQKRAEWYERENRRLVKALLFIKRQIETMNIESGYDPEHPEPDSP